jgi:hypothetical protein
MWSPENRDRFSQELWNDHYFTDVIGNPGDPFATPTHFYYGPPINLTTNVDFGMLHILFNNLTRNNSAYEQ